MRNALARIAAVLTLLLLAFGCAHRGGTCPCSPSAGREPDGVQGTWRVVAFEGRPVSERMASTRWTFADGRFEWVSADGTFTGTYSVDASTSPMRLTLRLEGEPGSGKAIVRLDGDTLLVKVNDVGDKGHATTFEPESHFDVYELRRVRDDDGAGE